MIMTSHFLHDILLYFEKYTPEAYTGDIRKVVRVYRPEQITHYETGIWINVIKMILYSIHGRPCVFCVCEVDVVCLFDDNHFITNSAVNHML